MPRAGWLASGRGRQLLPLLAGLGGLGLGALLVAGQALHARSLRQELLGRGRMIEELEEANARLSSELQASESERRGFDERIASLRQQFSAASSELEESRVSLQELGERYERLMEERAEDEARVAALERERDGTRERAERLEQERSDLERAVGRLRERLTLLDRDYRTLASTLQELRMSPQGTAVLVSVAGPKTHAARDAAAQLAAASLPQATVELPPIIVRKDQAGSVLPVRGRLLEVSLQHHFVVVDKGSEDGVRPGMLFDILRGGETVGRAQVVRVRPQLSACDVVRGSSPVPLQIGDLAVQRGSPPS